MLLRLILALLLAAFAVPAGAMPCHDEGAAMRGGMAMPAAPDAQHKASPVHACLGCIPPGDWLRGPLAVPLVTPTVPHGARLSAPMPGHAVAPALPPPRIG